MNGVLGGFKNMLRQWLKNLRLLKKKKYYSKFVSFVYSVIAIIYCPIGYMLEKNNKKIQQDNISKKIDEINISLNNIGKEKNLKKVEKEIKQLKKIVKLSANQEKKQIFSKQIKEIEKKVEYIKNESEHSLVKPKLIKKEKKQSKIISTFSKQNNVIKNSKKVNQPQKQNAISNEIPIVLPNEQLGFDDTNLLFIKKANKELKEIDSERKKIILQIPNINKYEQFYSLENNLKYLQNKIYLLKYKYNELKNTFNLDLELNFDDFELLKSDKGINEVLDNVANALKIIEMKKKELFNKKNLNVNFKKEEKKEEKPKSKEYKKEEIVTKEFIKAKEYVLNNIIAQNKFLDDYFKKINVSNNKKKTIFSSLFSFSKTIMNFTISLLPISIFKNKMLGTLVSTIMINNSIKSMRKMLNPQMTINYEMFLEDYLDNKSIINNIYNLCNNSLEELNTFKTEILFLNNYKDYQTLLKQIDLIEYNIIKQKEKLQMKIKKLDKVYVKIKNNIA